MCQNQLNKVGILPLASIPAVAGSLNLGELTKTFSSVSSAFGSIFGGGGNAADKGYCQISRDPNCFADNGIWTNSKDPVEYARLKGGSIYSSDEVENWGGTLLQIFRAINNNIGYDTRIEGTLMDILNPYVNKSGNPNWGVIASAGNGAKLKIFNYISKYYPKILPLFKVYIGDFVDGTGATGATGASGIVPISATGGTNTTTTNKTLLYVSGAVAAGLIIFLLARKKK